MARRNIIVRVARRTVRRIRRARAEESRLRQQRLDAAVATAPASEERSQRERDAAVAADRASEERSLRERDTAVAAARMSEERSLREREAFDAAEAPNASADAPSLESSGVDGRPTSGWDREEDAVVDFLVRCFQRIDAARSRRRVTVRTRPRRRVMSWLPWVAVLGLAWVWWATASSTAIARVAALQTVEANAFAVHDQLVRNFAFEGQFFQTIHKGYDDAWTWSGHRALTLIAAGWAYSMEPSAFGLSRMMVLAYLLGVVPAALLGRRITRGEGIGLWVGAVTYLGSPVLMALSLQDYQDLCFAAPALVFCWWAMTARGFWWAPIGTFVGMAPREETIPMAVGLAVLAVPMALSGKVRWKRWVWNVVAAIAVALVYLWWAETWYPVSGGGHDMPLENAVRGVTGGAARDIFLDGWGFLEEFYLDLLLPFGLVALLGVEGLVPACALVFLHMTVPVGHGVDRAWSGHAHHMAPAAGLMAIACSLAFGRLIRWTSPSVHRRRVAVHLAWGVALAVLAWQGWKPFAEEQNFRVTASVLAPEWVHPAWRLAKKLPADARPIASKDLSPTISNFSVSYTFDGSLRSKAKMEGLAAGTHMLVDTRQNAVVSWAMNMPGATVVARDDPFALVSWTPGSLDTQWAKMRKAQIPRPPPYVGRYNIPTHIPGVGPRVGGQKLTGVVPRIRLPWM